MIRVDNAVDYRKRMAEISMPIFQKYQKEQSKLDSKNDQQTLKKSFLREGISKDILN